MDLRSLMDYLKIQNKNLCLLTAVSYWWTGQTLHWNGVGYHDLGPHKIFSQDKQLINTVKLIPENDWLSVKKTSSIFLNGSYLNYPPSPFSLISVLALDHSFDYF